MAIFKTKHFRSEIQQPKSPPDGTSLEEQMNAFISTIPIVKLVDITTAVTHGQSARLVFTGMVIYQV